MPSFRVDKIISASGLYSRREAATLIKLGRVAVSGNVVMSGAEKLDPEKETVSIDGKCLEYGKYRYFMLNKPSGCVSATSDRCEKTVMDLLDDKHSALGLFPAGRLDKDAEGLMILTNNGSLAHKITSPGKKVGKKYFVQIDGNVSDDDIKAFADGLVLGDGTRCLPALLEPKADGAYVTIYEGKYHQVKRMMAAVGKPVKYLKRIAIGGIKLDDNLMPGEYRELRKEDFSSFK